MGLSKFGATDVELRAPVGAGTVMSDPIKMSNSIHFGEDFDLDLRSYELRRAGRILKLERIPTELLILLIEARGQMVTRDEIIERVWGKDVFLDTDNSINAAIRKIRQVLKDDPEQPRFVQTITGRGYRFIANVVEVKRGSEAGGAASKLADLRDPLAEKPVKHIEMRTSNLPVQRTGFVGREKELAATQELLLRQDIHLVTITGPGGIGKTRLAVRVASVMAEHFPGGTYFVPLSSLRDPGLVPSVIVQTLGIGEAGGQSPLEILRHN
jgi:DNA-binding winged helix-turn-helix (wHTH) protein